jgi:transcription antitermination factor NusG
MVKPQRENVVQEALEQKGLDVFLPMYWATRRWSDRVKRLKVPLFPQYVFCRADRSNRTTVLRTPGVRWIVSFGAEAIPVPEQEIEQIRRLVSSETAIEPWPFLRVGQRVRVDGGPLCGLEGILAEVRNTTRVVVGLELLQRSVAVELSRDRIRPLD